MTEQSRRPRSGPGHIGEHRQNPGSAARRGEIDTAPPFGAARDMREILASIRRLMKETPAPEPGAMPEERRREERARRFQTVAPPPRAEVDDWPDDPEIDVDALAEELLRMAGSLAARRAAAQAKAQGARASEAATPPALESAPRPGEAWGELDALFSFAEKALGEAGAQEVDQAAPQPAGLPAPAEEGFDLVAFPTPEHADPAEPMPNLQDVIRGATPLGAEPVAQQVDAGDAGAPDHPVASEPVAPPADASPGGDLVPPPPPSEAPSITEDLVPPPPASDGMGAAEVSEVEAQQEQPEKRKTEHQEEPEAEPAEPTLSAALPAPPPPAEPTAPAAAPSPVVAQMDEDIGREPAAAAAPPPVDYPPMPDDPRNHPDSESVKTLAIIGSMVRARAEENVASGETTFTGKDPHPRIAEKIGWRRGPKVEAEARPTSTELALRALDADGAADAVEAPPAVPAPPAPPPADAAQALRPMLADWLDQHLARVMEEVVEERMARLNKDGAPDEK